MGLAHRRRRLPALRTVASLLILLVIPNAVAVAGASVAASAFDASTRYHEMNEMLAGLQAATTSAEFFVSTGAMSSNAGYRAAIGTVVVRFETSLDAVTQLDQDGAFTADARARGETFGRLLSMVAGDVVDGLEPSATELADFTAAGHALDNSLEQLRQTIDVDEVATDDQLRGSIVVVAVGVATTLGLLFWLYDRRRRQVSFMAGERAAAVRTEAETRQREHAFRMLFASNPHPMWVYDVRTLRFLEVNDAAIARYGYSREEFLAMTVVDIRPDGAKQVLDGSVRPRAAYEHSTAWQHRLRDGRVIDVEMSSHTLDFAGRKAALVVAQDVTERQRLENELSHQALHDALTALPNRLLFRERLGHALERLRREAGPAQRHVGLVLLDLDDFKVINDSLGHDAGDDLLVAVARRLENGLRSVDTAARLGGDEFTLLLEDLVQPEDALPVAARILELLSEPFRLGDRSLTVGASLGIAVASTGEESSDDLIRRADVALYDAKSRGKNRFALFDPEMAERAWQRLEQEADLRRGIEAAELRVVYQPIVELASGEIREVEALVRWEHPQRGLVSPAEFIPLAEESGLIVPLGAFVMRAACAQLNQWRAQFPHRDGLVMAVNISPRQFRQSGLVETVRAALEESGVPAGRLKLEITENAILDDEEATLATIRALRALGVRIALDDFGTGYSSFGYFRRFPIDCLKIDRSFVEGLGHDEQATAIVRAALSFAAAVGLETTGEGIEDEAQATALRALGCDLGQGFRYARPVPPDAFAELIAVNRRDASGSDLAA